MKLNGFTILEEDEACSTAGNHCLAIFKEPESYGSLKKCLSDLITEVDTLSSIEVSVSTFDIEYCLGGDWKFWQWLLPLTVHHPLMPAYMV